MNGREFYKEIGARPIRGSIFRARIAFLYFDEGEEWRTGEWLERGHEIVFRAASRPDAVRSVLRWVVDRQANVPQHFTGMGSFTLADYPVGFVGPDGTLVTGAPPFMEWKWDGSQSIGELAHLVEYEGPLPAVGKVRR